MSHTVKTSNLEPNAVGIAPDLERHPFGLYALFATEMWERFGFYTAAAVMTLYLQRGGFEWTRDDATNLWSYYLMFVYATPLVGGWLVDAGCRLQARVEKVRQMMHAVKSNFAEANVVESNIAGSNSSIRPCP